MVPNTMPKIIAMTIETALFACGLWGGGFMVPGMPSPGKTRIRF